MAEAATVQRPRSAYSDFGAKLISLGYCAVPSKPGTKVPGNVVAGRWQRMERWAQRFRDRLPSDRDVESWERTGEGGICLICGQASQGVVAIDIDTDASVGPVTSALPFTPVKKRGRKGETLFFRNPHGVASKSFTLVRPDKTRERLVDILAEGRQTVLPPTNHPDTGQPYIWTGDSALFEVEPADLPDLPANAHELIAAALADVGYSADMERVPIVGLARSSDDEKSPFRLLNEHALANLDAWVPRLPLCRLRRTGAGFEAVADWRPSNTGRPLDRRKLNLKISPSGIVDFGDGQKGYTAIDLVVASDAVADVDRAFAWLADATGWGGAVVHAPKPRKTLVEAGVVADAETGEVIFSAPEIEREGPESKVAAPISSAAVAPASLPPWKAPIDPTRCPGLVGEIADWIVATAEYQQPLLAIGAALAVVGTVAGRQLAGPTNSATHLFVLGVAPTGAGKDRPLKAVRRLLLAVGPQLVGPGRFTSDTAVVNELTRSPVIGCAIDEFGAFLARMKSRNASTHEQGITSVLREVWSNKFEPFVSTARASERSTTLHSLGMSIFGTSTSAELYGALSSADVASGLLNRFLVLNGEAEPQENDDPLDASEIPADIVEGLKAIYWRLGELGAAPYHGQGDVASPPPRKIPWGDAGAHRKWKEFRAKVQTAARAGDQIAADLLVRSAEMSVRIATIRAIGIDPASPSIGQSDIDWAIALVERSAKTLIDGARNNIAENERERRANRIIDAIKRLTSKTPACTRRDIGRNIGTSVASREVDDILSQLVDAERVKKIDLTDGRSDTVKRIGYALAEG